MKKVSTHDFTMRTQVPKENFLKKQKKADSLSWIPGTSMVEKTPRPPHVCQGMAHAPYPPNVLCTCAYTLTHNTNLKHK